MIILRGLFTRVVYDISSTESNICTYLIMLWNGNMCLHIFHKNWFWFDCPVGTTSCQSIMLPSPSLTACVSSFERTILDFPKHFIFFNYWDQTLASFCFSIMTPFPKRHITADDDTATPGFLLNVKSSYLWLNVLVVWTWIGRSSCSMIPSKHQNIFWMINQH